MQRARVFWAAHDPHVWSAARSKKISGEGAETDAIGPKPKCRNVGDLVAIGWKADVTQTSNFR